MSEPSSGASSTPGPKRGKKQKPKDMLCIRWQWGGTPCRRYHR